MFHEEKVINGVMHWRGTPDGTWTDLSREALTDRLVASRAEAGALRNEVGCLRDLLGDGEEEVQG